MLKFETQRHRSLHPINVSLGFVVIAALYSTTSIAQFADDFSVDSTRYSSRSFDDSGGVSSTVGEVGGIRMSASSDGSVGANQLLSVAGASDSLEVTFSFDPAVQSFTDETGFADFRVEGNIYNDLADGGTGGENRSIGDVFVGVNVGLDGFGNSTASACVIRQGENGNEDLLVFDDSDTGCASLGDITVTAGTNYTVGYSLDRAAQTLTFTVNDVQRTVMLPSQPFQAASHANFINVAQDNGAGSTSAVISAIRTDSGVDDFSTGVPIVGRYNPFFNLDGDTRNVEVVDGELQMTVSSDPDSGFGIGLEPREPTDYLEALVTISSGSDFSGTQMRTQARVQAVLFNDTADGGTDRRLGDVRAELDLAFGWDGLRRSEYCLARFDDADGDSRTGLLDGRNCIELPIVVELDTAYRMAISLDRINSTVIFNINGVERIVPIESAIFDAAEPIAQVTGESRNGAQSLVTIDDVRTSAIALTATETLAGLTTPPTFPAAGPVPVAESTIEFPFDFNQTVSFVDDFSENTALFGYNRFPDNAVTSIQYRDGAVELQSHADNADDPASSSLDINGATDSIKVRVSLSSRSAVSLGEGEASFDLETVFFNDTADGGNGSREGDMQSKIRIITRSNGRREISAELRRRDADGNNERLAVFNGEDGFNFDNLIPELDTIYELGIELDREQGVVMFSVDDLSFDVQLTTEAFLPARGRTQLRAWHDGSSGRSIARIFSVQTDSVDLDFLLEPPVIGPYRTPFEAQGIDRSLEVVDGRLRLQADDRTADGSDPRIVVLGRSDFIGATLELSSESIVAEGSDLFIDISGTLYNDIADSTEGSEGNVFAALRFGADGDGQRYVATCAFRSNDANFDSASELIGGDTENCPRMSFVPEFDTEYPASMKLDRANATLSYSFADEVFVYNIPTGIFENEDAFNGVRARAGSGAMVIAFADDLAFSESPVALASSDEQLAQDTDSGGLDDGTGGSGGSSSGSSSGCSIAAAGGLSDYLLLILSLGAFVSLVYRRRAV